MYEMIETMTIASGYNYDWQVNKSGDRFFKAENSPRAHIVEGDENNVDDIGGLGSNQYIDDLNFTITCKVAISDPDVSPENVSFEQSQLVSNMRDDIKKRFSSPAYMCDQRQLRPEIVFKARTLRYLRSRSRIETEEGKFSTFRLECDIVVKYESERF